VPPAPPTPDVAVIINSVNGTDGYILSGDATGENATINVTVDDLLSITNNTGAHPLYIKTTAGTGTGDQVIEGTVTGQGATNGEVTWDTTGVTPGTYYYQCSAHANMNGEIVVS
jgi:plastocyanin